MLFDHYLSIRMWSLDFVSSSAIVDSTLVWIHFPSLNLGYYNEDVLMSMASMVGKLMKIDLNTLNASQGKFATVCVEVCLNKPIVGKICVDNN